jgi:hypothetical protein
MNWKGYGRKWLWPDEVKSRHLTVGTDKAMKNSVRITGFWAKANQK